MKQALAKQIEALKDMTVTELRERYLEAFGEPTASRHKDFLRKRIAGRLQANECGGPSLVRVAAAAKSPKMGRCLVSSGVTRPPRPDWEV